MDPTQAVVDILMAISNGDFSDASEALDNLQEWGGFAPDVSGACETFLDKKRSEDLGQVFASFGS